MKQRILTILLSLCMLLSLLPAAAGAADVPAGVTFKGGSLYANGNAITLKEGADETKTLVYLDSDPSNPNA